MRRLKAIERIEADSILIRPEGNLNVFSVFEQEATFSFQRWADVKLHGAGCEVSSSRYNLRMDNGQMILFGNRPHKGATKESRDSRRIFRYAVASAEEWLRMESQLSFWFSVVSWEGARLLFWPARNLSLIADSRRPLRHHVTT